MTRAWAKRQFMATSPVAHKQKEDTLVPRFEGWTQLFYKAVQTDASFGLWSPPQRSWRFMSFLARN